MIGEDRAPCGSDLLCIMGRNGAIDHEPHCPERVVAEPRLVIGELGRPRKPSCVDGVWTPGAEVLCGRCHGPVFPNKTLGAVEFERWCEQVVEESEDSGPTRCDRCNRPVMVDAAVAAYARLRDRLHMQNEAGERPVVAKLEQTGGMCSALSVRPAGQNAPVVFVAGRDDGPLFCVAVYPNEDAVYEAAGEDCGSWESEDEAAQVVRNALGGA